MEWIPTKEALPVDTGYYLTTVKTLFSTYEVDRSYYCDKEKKFLFKDVIAWHTFPEPYSKTSEQVEYVLRKYQIIKILKDTEELDRIVHSDSENLELIIKRALMDYAGSYGVIVKVEDIYQLEVK